jgi:hypothetical protein
VAVSTHDFALRHFIKHYGEPSILVRANGELFFAANMVEIQGCRVLSVAAVHTAGLHLDLVQDFTDTRRTIPLVLEGGGAAVVASATAVVLRESTVLGSLLARSALLPGAV